MLLLLLLLLLLLPLLQWGLYGGWCSQRGHDVVVAIVGDDDVVHRTTIIARDDSRCHLLWHRTRRVDGRALRMTTTNTARGMELLWLQQWWL